MKEAEKAYDLAKLARYPFLKEAREYVSSIRINISDIQDHPLYSDAIEDSKQRIKDRMSAKPQVVPEEKLPRELSILSYAIARILVNHIGNRQLSYRYASAEAESAYSFLLRETSRKAVQEEVMKDLSFNPGGGKMHYTEYLRVSANLSKQEPKWKLVNKALEAGYISVDESETLMLLREVIRLKVLEPIDTKTIPDNLKKAANEIAGIYIRKPDDIKIDQVNENAVPPCLKSMMASLENGTISHNERFIIATFYIGAGLNIDGLLKVFSHFPNYNEEKTRYQLEFLNGEKGATKYNCPSCAKIKSFGLCKAECDVKHPLSYYLKNRRIRFSGK
jgi:DNA primase large subunit